MSMFFALQKPLSRLKFCVESVQKPDRIRSFLGYSRAWLPAAVAITWLEFYSLLHVKSREFLMTILRQ